MEGLMGKLVPIAMSVVMGLVLTYPRTWRVELAKLQYSILREATRTDNWGSVGIYAGHANVNSKKLSFINGDSRYEKK